MFKVLILFISVNALAQLEVIKPDFSNKKIILKIVRAYPGIQ